MEQYKHRLAMSNHQGSIPLSFLYCVPGNFGQLVLSEQHDGAKLAKIMPTASDVIDPVRVAAVLVGQSSDLLRSGV